MAVVANFPNLLNFLNFSPLGMTLFFSVIARRTLVRRGNPLRWRFPRSLHSLGMTTTAPCLVIKCYSRAQARMSLGVIKPRTPNKKKRPPEGSRKYRKWRLKLRGGTPLGSRSRRNGPMGRSGCDSKHGSSPRRRSNCRRATRGIGRMTVP